MFKLNYVSCMAIKFILELHNFGTILVVSEHFENCNEDQMCCFMKFPNFALIPLVQLRLCLFGVNFFFQKVYSWFPVFGFTKVAEFFLQVKYILDRATMWWERGLGPSCGGAQGHYNLSLCDVEFELFGSKFEPLWPFSRLVMPYRWF